MADIERTILDHYQLSTAHPSEWPAEKDNSDASDDEEEEAPKSKQNGSISAAASRRKSKYFALERASDRKSLIPGSQKIGNGVENLVQRDEPDPLGSTDSVVRILRQLGLPVQEDIGLRNRFLLSSTTFSPSLFLSQVHSTASTQDLLQGLDILSRSIDQKSASLKVLVESNFERFVRAKATIDNVYTEMKYQGVEPPAAPRARPHSRHASRNSFRTSSGNQAGMMNPLPNDARKKNALLKESEFGVLGIKTPLLEVSAKAEEVWGPALGGREKEDSLKVVLGTVDRYKQYYEVNAAITDSIKRRDYESIVEEYTKAKRFADDAKKLMATLGSTPPTDAQLHQILLAARVWHDVEEQIDTFKRDVWKRLTTSHGSSRTDGLIGAHSDQYMESIAILLELENKIQATSDRSKVEIEILRRRLASTEKPASQLTASHLRSLGRQIVDNKQTSVDSPDVIELWEKIDSFLQGILSAQGILGEVLDFWQTSQGFIEGRAQKSLPVGINGRSREHHRLSQENVRDLEKGIVELIDMIRETLRDPRFAFDANNLPPPSPRRGEAWEKFAFWPPWSNSASGVHYLSKFLALVGTGASEMSTVSPVGNGDGTALERLKALVGGTRERCVTAILAAWNKDAENIKVLEDWRRSSDQRDLTRMPSNFSAFEGVILSGMQKILYVSDATIKQGSPEIILPPPPKLLQMVRSQFVTTLYKALSGMVENAEKAVKKTDDDWTTDSDGLASPEAMAMATSMGAGTVNASDRNVRMLLTLSNLHALRSSVVPSLTTQFENAFSVKLTEEAKTIKDVLGQIDTRLFHSYTRVPGETLRAIVRRGVLAPDWAPKDKPKEVRPYVYEALLTLVLVHTQVSTTASSLTTQVLSYLLEEVSQEFLSVFKQRQQFPLNSLMQATLDIEFVAQTMSQFTTDRASETQSQIYQELDKGTDDEARAKLQKILPGMRVDLKRLREASKVEFACFKKVRNKGGDRSGSSTTQGST
ncbi:Exocyst complex component SEC5 protein [Rutstroemia sp. NJR-2017a BBW]|nr:Exocyst complex component SEC5 protein [Rutstroemia sp. NJR-2017a BBW]